MAATVTATLPLEAVHMLAAMHSSMFESLAEIASESETDEPMTVPVNCSLERLDQLVAYVLHGTRPPCVHTLPQLATAIREWDAMIDFLDVPIVYPGNPTLNFMDALTGFPELKRSVELNVFRRRHIFNIRGALDRKPFAFLHPISDLAVPPSSKAAESTGVCAMLRADDLEAKKKEAKKDATEEAKRDLRGMVKDFERTLDWFGSEFQSLPWYDGKSGVILAGGYLTAALYGLSRPEKVLENTDVDMFIIVNHIDFADKAHVQAETYRIFKQTIQALCGDKKAIVKSVKSNVINLLIIRPYYMKLQIVIAVYDTPTHVVNGFDIPLCKILYTPKSGGMLTHDAIRAFQTNQVLFDETTMSISGVHRYIKYMRRYNVSVLIPGITQEYLIGLIGLIAPNSTVMRLRNSENSDNNGTILALLSHERLSRSRSRRHRNECSDYSDADVPAIYNKASRDLKHWRLAMKQMEFPVMTMKSTTVFTGALHPLQTNIYRDLPLRLDVKDVKETCKGTPRP